MDSFRTAVEARDLDSMMAVFSDDVSFHSPIVHRTYHGKDELRLILAGVLQVFDELRYVDEYRSDTGVVLHFMARIGDREVDGIDMLEFGSDGLCHTLTVMVRPYSGASLLRERMAALLQAAG